jgi:hypothetical protein
MRSVILSIAGVCLLASATSAQTTGKQAPMVADTALVVIDIQQFTVISVAELLKEL